MVIMKLTRSFPIRVMEWLLSGIMLSWSVVCWNLRPEEWAQPIFSGLAVIADQNTWAFFAFWIGTTRLAMLGINGAWRPSPHLRALGAFLSCFMWLQLTLGIVAAEMRGVGIAILPWLLIADIYNVFRASNDARMSDDRARAAHDVSGVGDAVSAAH